MVFAGRGSLVAMTLAVNAGGNFIPPSKKEL
jgi:hypothetical protein